MSRFLLPFALLTTLACTRTTTPADANHASPLQGAVALPEAPSPADSPTLVEAAKGQQLFLKYCSLCHGKEAEGYAADNAPSLVSRTFRETVSTEFLRTSIARGRPGTAMAAYAQEVGGPLSKTDIDQIIGFTRKIALPQPQPPTVLLAEKPNTGAVGRGQNVYMTQCASCHGWTSQRGSAVHLFNPQFLASASDSFLRYAIQKGRPGTKMEPWTGKLTEQQMDDVLAYVRSMATSVPPAPVVPWRAPQPVAPILPPPGQEAAPAITGPIVIHPNGKEATIKMKDDRIAPLEEVAAAYKDKRRMVIIDARAPSDYLRLHVAGAVSVPYYDPHELDKIPNDGTWVIAYCACPTHASGEIVDQLRKRNFKNTAILDEGIFAWKTKGNPVVEAPQQGPTPVPPPPPPSQLVVPPAQMLPQRVMPPVPPPPK
jgi:cytochrome c oxidase cbb3-type subunit 3